MGSVANALLEKAIKTTSKLASSTANTPREGTGNLTQVVGGSEAAAGSLAAQQAGAAPVPNYEIDYNDQRFKDVEADKQAALGQYNAQYDKMLGATDELYQGLIDATTEYGEKQSQLQQEQTDFAIEKFNQQKEQAAKDYKKEQQGAFVDWQRQSDQYGAVAERMATQGLQGSGYSESSQVRMWTGYQNRIAVARESYQKAILDYDNDIKEAILTNNAAKAEIAFQTLQKRLSLGIEQAQYENELLKQQMDMLREIDNMYYGRQQDIIAQMNHENALAEDIRQYNESMEMERQQMQIAQQQWEAEYSLQQRQYEESIRQWESEYSLQQRQYEESIRQFEVELKRLKQNDAKANELAIKELELKKKQLQQEQKQWEAQMKEEKRQFNKTYDLQIKNLNSSSGSSKSSGSSGSSKSSGSSGNVKISKSSSSGSSGGGSISGPTAAQKKTYGTFQTNIANMMMKNPGESTRNSMAKSIEEAYESGKLTKSQAKELLGQLD